jgi:hypothetical protein
MLSFRLQDGTVYVLPHILEMRKDINALNKSTRDNTINSLRAGLADVVAKDGPDELVRLGELEAAIGLRLKAIDREVLLGTRSPGRINVSSAISSFERNNGPTKEGKPTNPEFGNVFQSSLGINAYGVSEVYRKSSVSDLQRREFIVSRQNFYKRELQVALQWIAARRVFINAPLG